MDSHTPRTWLAQVLLLVCSQRTQLLTLYFMRACQGSELFFAMCIGYTFRATPLNVIYHSASTPLSPLCHSLSALASLVYYVYLLGALPARAAASDRARRQASASGDRLHISKLRGNQDMHCSLERLTCSCCRSQRLRSAPTSWAVPTCSHGDKICN